MGVVHRDIKDENILIGDFLSILPKMIIIYVNLCYFRIQIYLCAIQLLILTLRANNTCHKADRLWVRKPSLPRILPGLDHCDCFDQCCVVVIDDTSSCLECRGQIKATFRASTTAWFVDYFVVINQPVQPTWNRSPQLTSTMVINHNPSIIAKWNLFSPKWCFWDQSDKSDSIKVSMMSRY